MSLRPETVVPNPLKIAKRRGKREYLGVQPNLRVWFFLKPFGSAFRG
jgi:hypothetical protein